MNETILIILLISMIMIFIFMHFKEVKYIESYSGTKYLVRNLGDKKKAANIIDKIIQNINKLIKYIYNKDNIKYEFIYPYIKTIKERFPNCIFRESTSKNKFTSYSINKGEEIVLCLRSKTDNKLHDINEIMYVTIHEIAHIGCPEIGHTPLFNKINKQLLEFAIECGIYTYKNYNYYPEDYCGIKIDTTLLN